MQLHLHFPDGNCAHGGHSSYSVAHNLPYLILLAVELLATKLQYTNLVPSVSFSAAVFLYLFNDMLLHVCDVTHCEIVEPYSEYQGTFKFSYCMCEVGLHGKDAYLKDIHACFLMRSYTVFFFPPSSMLVGGK